MTKYAGTLELTRTTFFISTVHVFDSDCSNTHVEGVSICAHSLTAVVDIVNPNEEELWAM
jgi:hypothetical protein